MRIELYQSPVISQPTFTATLHERLSILEILEAAGAPPWFMEFGVIRMNGVVISRDNWARIKIKPEADGLLELCVIPQKKSTLIILASVALVALTAGIGAGILAPFLGAGFAAGGLGSVLSAAAVGIAGQLLISQLTAPPKSSLGGDGTNKDLSQAGISTNRVTPLETLPVVLGRMMVSPPLISVPYTTLLNKEVTVNAIVGLQGRCLIENLQINGSSVTLLEDLQYETREGAAGDAPLTIAQLICLQDNLQSKLANYDGKILGATNDQLVDQVTPANSLPHYQYYTTDGIVDEVWLRLLFPAGIYRTDTFTAVVPIRIEIRKVGDVPWIKLPTVHVQDLTTSGSPIRVEIKLKFKRTETRNIITSGALEYPVREIYNITGIGQSFEYRAHSHFEVPTFPGIFPPSVLDDPATNLIPFLTGPTTAGPGGNFICSASSELSGTAAAWKARDGLTTTGWQPANNSLPAWWKIRCPIAINAKSIFLSFNTTLTMPDGITDPTMMYFEGSNDDINWTRLDDKTLDQRDNVCGVMFIAISNPQTFTWFRITFLANNGAANQQILVTNLCPMNYEAPGLDITTGSWVIHSNAAGGKPRCANACVTPDGADIYLDPALFPIGQYEIRVKRGSAIRTADLNMANYANAGNLTTSDFFGYYFASGVAKMRVGQKLYRSDAIVETFSSVSNSLPVNTTGICCVAMALTNATIDSISAIFTSYAPHWNGTIWDPIEQITQNPAELYRDLLTGVINPDPTPVSILNDPELQAWYARCVTKGYQCNAIVQGRSIDEVKQLIAYTGYASPRDSALVSIATDYDRAADAISQQLSPLNSKNKGFSMTLPRLPHAIYAEYLDETNNWKIRRDLVYRTGFNAGNSTLFDTITYDGFTNPTKVAARAKFDIKQMELRAASYTYEIGIEGYSIERGDLIGLSDDTINLKNSFGLIQSIQVSGPNTTGITVDNIIPFSTIGAAGVAIRLSDGTSVVKTLTNVTDSNACIFTTPFTTAGSGVSAGALCAFGAAGSEFKRVIVTAIQPNGLDTRTITLKDEAPGIWL